MTAVLGTPLWIERRAVPGAVRLGMGARTTLPAGDAFLIAGVAGGLARSVRAGDVVVAPDASAPLLAGTLRRMSLTVHVGPIHTSDHVVTGAERERLARTGALAVDMETSLLRSGAGDRPFAAVRVITDGVGAPLWSPGTLLRSVRALKNLRTAAPALRQWAQAAGGREVVLAAPESFRAAAQECDLVLVVGSGDSSSARRLVEVAERAGVEAHLVGDAGDVELAWLARARTVGVGTSAPPHLVDHVVAALAGLGPVTVRVPFTLSKEVS